MSLFEFVRVPFLVCLAHLSIYVTFAVQVCASVAG